MTDDTLDHWQILNVPKETKARIKAYAARHDMTIGQALTELINQVEQVNKGEII